MAEKMSIDDHDPTKDDQSEDSMDSSPEGDAPLNVTPQENQQPKRKGGRKPVCLVFLPCPAGCFTHQDAPHLCFLIPVRHQLYPFIYTWRILFVTDLPMPSCLSLAYLRASRDK